MKASFGVGKLVQFKGDAIGLFAFENKKTMEGQGAGLDPAVKAAVAAAIKRGEFTGDKEETLTIRSAKGPGLVIVAGVGPKKELCSERVRRAAARVAKVAEKAKVGSIGFSVDGLGSKKVSATALTAAIYEGAELAIYGFDTFKSKKTKKHLKAVTVLSETSGDKTACEKALKQAVAVCESVTLVRDLGHTPGGDATPTMLAATAQAAAKKHGFQCKVLNRPQMEKLGMGGLLGVARGSVEPPKFIIMEHGRKAAGKKTVVIVGKGLTFDSGGISLKPGANMHEMKYDKMGGCTTIGVMQAAARLKLKLHLVGLVPATENLPDGAAQKPGDVVTAMNGKTIEVLNTDAEGRLILADALGYAERYKPDAVVDLATLTGAVIMALGHYCSAVMGNDQKLIDALLQAGDTTHERLWQLPLWEEYHKAMKGTVADLANISSGGGAGTITAGAFLSNFAEKYKWAHIDIAGTAWVGNDVAPYIPKGPSGTGVRMLIEYLSGLAQA